MALNFYKNEILTGHSGVYILQNFLGNCAFGGVYKGLKQGTDEAVALKFITMDHSDSAFREVVILAHLKELQAHQNNLIKLIDHFVYNDCFCLVFEMLDMNLFDLLKMRQEKPLDVSEVRVVARDLLVALNALKNAGVTHADIKPDNIMLVNHQSQPFRVKLIDFGLAMETHELQNHDVIPVCGYRAPEVNLGLPLTEAVDMWAVACTLAFIFLGDDIHNPICEFNNMRQIFKLHGLPDQDLLGKGTKVDRFFIFDESNQTWRFKTPQEYTKAGNKITISREHLKYKLDSLDDFFEIHPQIQYPFELEDLQSFIDLLKKMFTVNPSERITPEEALNHRFITMSHLPPTSNNPYVISAYEKMKAYRMEEEEPSISPDFNVKQAAERKSDLFDFNPSDYDLSDSDLSDLEDSDSGLFDFDLSDSDLSDLDTDEESNEPANTSDFQLLKIQEANLSDMKLHDSELEGSRRDRLDGTSFELYKDQTITGESGVYIVQKFLGRGAFGQVVKGLKQGTDEVVALKFIHKDDSESATAEATILKHLRELQADQKNLIKLIDHFEYNDSFCFVFEMLDMNLFDLLEMRQEKPLDVSEVRVVARDLLVALSALKNAGVTHTDIKPDNVMLVNHQSQPFRVKLIDFGLAMETHELRRCGKIQVCGYRAPEVNLGLPLTEAVDMWAVACTLAFISLGDHIHVPRCEFNNMRQIFKLHGLPDQDLLGKGTKVDRFFIFDQSNQTWRFKTPQEYTEAGYKITISREHLKYKLDSLDDFIEIHQQIQYPIELEDLQSFIDLLKKMFTVNPSERITPEEALNHRFITMSHLPPTSNNSYVISAYEKMKVDRMEKEEPSISPDFNVKQAAERKSDLFDSNPSDYDLSDSDLSDLEDSDSGLSDFDLSDSDLSDLDTDEECNEPANTSDFQLLKIQEANLSDMKLHDSELEGSRRDRLDGTSFELYKDQTITGESGVYIVQKFLGRGAFGQVVKGLKQGTDEVVALKFISMDHSDSAFREVVILAHLKELQAHQNNLIKLIDHFVYNDCFCLVFEMLDMNLFDLLKMRQEKPLDVSEVRVVARDLLVALNALKNAGVTHTDIKPDNVTLVNHQSQPFRVKLIDFGLAMETHELQNHDVTPVCGYRAPEVNLGLPLTEAVDMWAVACTLAFIFLGDDIHNPICEFNNMRQIFKLHGLPDQDLLDKGTKVDRFFIFDQSNQTWRFKTPHEYTEAGNQITISREYLKYKLDSLDDFFEINPQIQYPFELEDLQSFIDLLKKMFTVNPSERITPEEALNHRFITMSHLPPTSNNSYVISAYEKMKVYRMEEEETSSLSPGFIVGQTADSKSDLFDLNLSDYDLSDSDLCELEDSNSDLSDISY